jgi:two-component sensor histidine kinase
LKRFVVFGWPLIGTLVLSFEAVIRALLGAPLPADVLLWGWIGWLEWALLAPLVAWLGSRFPYRPGGRRTFFLVHSLAPFAVSALHSSIYFTLRTLVLGWPGAPGESLGAVWIARLPGHLTLDVLVYSATLLFVQVALFLRAAWERDQDRLALERRIAQAELDVFKLQLPADVVAEKLEQIEEEIERDPTAAEGLIAQFSTFLRQSLAAARSNASEDGDAVAHDEDDVAVAMPRPLPLPVRLLIVVGIVPGVLLVLHAFGAVSAVAQGRPIAWAQVANSLSLSWFSWPVTLLMLWLGARVRRMALLAVAAAAVPPLWDLAFHTIRSGWPATRLFLLSSSRTIDFLVFFGIALGGLAYQRYFTWRRNAVEIAELDARLLRTRALLLRLQLNPHFLFNALNSIAALLDDDPSAARTMAARLRQFVERVLRTYDLHEVPLGEELDLLATYVAIENVRFGDRLELDVRADAGTRAALVPSFLLQPLVENAVRHGLQPATGGRVSVNAAVSDGDLRLEVLDNGRARGAAALREGIGLSNTRARLRQLYGDDYTLDVARGEQGFSATLTIPVKMRRT